MKYPVRKNTPAIQVVLALFFLITAGSIFSSSAHAEKNIRGRVTDAETGNGLYPATIQVRGLRQGTITNPEGAYLLPLDNLPATIRASFIGYTSRHIEITAGSPDVIDFELVPRPVVLETVVIRPDDPAVGIMREVIRRKQEWRATQKTYRADAYTRVALMNDSTIVSISESVSEVFWDADRGSRELIRSKRQTKNTLPNQNFASARMIPNFYDDDIDVLGFNVIGPTHPDAFSYYDFKLIGQRRLDDRLVFDLSVTPRSLLQPAFTGEISVLDEEFAVIEVRLKPGDTIIMPPPLDDIDLSFEQQFSNFGKSYWLPVDVRIDGAITVRLPGILFPTIRYRQMTRLTDYHMNVPLPDSLYEGRKPVSILTITNGEIAIETDEGLASPEQPRPSAADSLFETASGVIPLTSEEEKAYSTIDSTDTFQKAFRPSGFLTQFMNLNDGSTGKDASSGKKRSRTGKVFSGIVSHLTPRARFNRVDGAGVGLMYRQALKENRISFSAGTAYLSGLKRWSFDAGALLRLGAGKRGFLSLDYRNGTEPRAGSGQYPIFMNSFLTLLGGNDYYDYLLNEKVSISGGYRLTNVFNLVPVKISLALGDERHRPVEKSTDYTIMNGTENQRENPAVPAGRLRSLVMTIALGNDSIPFGLAGQKRAELNIEHSSPSFLSSDFSFTRSWVVIDWKLNTFLRRRMLPNTLDIRFTGGTSNGDLPIQRFGTIDGNLGTFSPFGVFRSLRGHPLEGASYCALFWEHNFRTVPFELIGLRSLVRKGTGIILHGAAGRTWIAQTRLNNLSYRPYYLDRMHHEIGLSINSLFGFFRVDITKPLYRHGVVLGFAAARFY